MQHMKGSGRITFGNLPFDELGQYLSWDAVDLYFNMNVSYRNNIQLEGARQVVFSLQFFTKWHKYADANEAFVVESKLVIQALECHKQ